MAKKSKRDRSRKPQPYLRRRDRIRVVACLDYSLEHNVDLTSVAVSHLDSLRDYEHDVAHKAIHGALRGEYRDYGRGDGDISFEAFLAEGSAFLRYGKDDPETLRVERSRIQFPLGRQHPLRSAPRTSSARTGTSRTLSSRLSTRSDTSSLSVRSTPEFEGLVDTIAEQTPRAATPTLLPRPSHKNGRKSRASASATPAATITRFEQNSCPAQAREIAETASLLPPQSGILESRLSMVEGELAAKSEELRAALRSNAEKEDYIFTLSSRLLAAEKECKEMERSISKAAEHKQNASIQENLRYEYSVLRDQNIKMISQRRVISLATKMLLGPTNQDIREEFELILAGLKDACSSVDIMIPTTARTVDDDIKEDKVELWSQRLGSSSLCELGSRASADDISDIHLMTALVAVGIAELVFESNFPDFLARESPLLDQYREHILSRAGPETLSELDLLAYHSILSTPDNQDDSHFQSHLLPNTARSVSSKLVSAIASLISSSDETTTEPRPSRCLSSALTIYQPHNLALNPSLP